uniref:DUF1036 domain-containing protein n=1 Tax=Pararhizobium sp. IMCC3301 TaxID=3067904 RepID=UPI002740EF9F|nr:DUF1036 domain-containing protein [Pararhizobium sp. IMCC3301]
MSKKSEIQVSGYSGSGFESQSSSARRILPLTHFLAPFSARVTKAVILFALSLSMYGGLSFISSDQASAELRICNKSGSRVGISVGYRNDKGWTTEGWWNLEATSCEVILPGALKSQYYYMFAVDYDEGGEWAGSAFMCTADKIFTINGIEDCLTRGFQRTGFFEIDTGTQTSWTVQLTEPTQRGTGGK